MPRVTLLVVGLAFFLLYSGGPPALPALAEEPFVAVILTGDLPRYRAAHEAFVHTLRGEQEPEGEVRIYVQTPNPDHLSLINSARKAVGLGADLIVTYGAPATLVARNESRGSPVLFADVYDPGALDPAEVFSGSDSAVAGVSSKTPLRTLITTFAEIRPLRRMGVLFCSSDPSSQRQLDELEALAGRLGFSLVPRDIVRRKDISRGLLSLDAQVDSLFVAESAFLNLELQTIVEYSFRQRIPVLSQIPGFAELGALITLEADPAEQGRLAGVRARAMLSGQTSLSIDTPKKVALVINLQTARRIGVSVPFQALTMATKVIR